MMVQCRANPHVIELPCSECALQPFKEQDVVGELPCKLAGAVIPGQRATCSLRSILHLALVVEFSRLRPLQLHPEVLNIAQNR